MINYRLVQGNKGTEDNDARDFLLGNGFLKDINDYMTQLRTSPYNPSPRVQASQARMQMQNPIRTQLGFTRLNVEQLIR